MKSSPPGENNKESTLKKTLKTKPCGKKVTTTTPRRKLTLEDNLANELTAMLSINSSTPLRKHKCSSWSRLLEEKKKNREQLERKLMSLVHLFDYIETFVHNHSFLTGKKSDTSCSTFPHVGGRNINIWPPLDVWSKRNLDEWRCHYKIADKFRFNKIDLSHITEFSTFTFYMDFAYTDLMKFTEEMISGLIKQERQQFRRSYYANGLNKDPIKLDFRPPFRRIRLIEALEKLANLNIPKDFSSDLTNMYLVDACIKYDIKCPHPQTNARLLEKLVERFLVEKCVNPTFIIDYPEVMNPLAKSHRSKPGLTESFKLFINKNEFCNGHAALIDPVLYRERFLEQLKDCQSGQHEFMAVDETSTTGLESGFCATGNWSLGIDRLLMLLLAWRTIKEQDSAKQDAQSSKGSKGHMMDC